MSQTGVNEPIIRRSEQTARIDDTGGIGFRRTEPIDSRLRESVRDTLGANALAPVIDIDRFYEAPAGQTGHVIKAIELLAESARLLEIARSMVAVNPIEADRSLQRFRLLLPELFSCRIIGDGFALIISTLEFAFGNLQERLPTADQISVMWRTLRELRSRPVLPFDQALLCVADFETHGLEVDPPILSSLLDQPEDE
jgi:hypothetical protein